MSKPEARAARKALIEPTRGFGLDNYEQQIGMGREEAEAFTERVRSFFSTFKEETDEQTFLISHQELQTLRNGLELTLEVLGEDEYYYRSGQTYQVAKDALAEFNRILAEIGAS